jgi:hypothetical protein
MRPWQGVAARFGPGFHSGGPVTELPDGPTRGAGKVEVGEGGASPAWTAANPVQAAADALQMRWSLMPAT